VIRVQTEGRDTEQRDGLIYYFLPENSGGALACYLVVVVGLRLDGELLFLHLFLEEEGSSGHGLLVH
jgi:hypothetical protein